MKAILKINPNGTTPAPMLFIIKNEGFAMKEVSKVSRKYYESLIKLNMLKEIDQITIIEKFYLNRDIISCVKDCNYYEIKLI